MGSASEAESDDGEPERADEYRRGAVDELRADGDEKHKDWARHLSGAEWIAAGRHGEVFQVQGQDVVIKVTRHETIEVADPQTLDRKRKAFLQEADDSYQASDAKFGPEVYGKPLLPASSLGAARRENGSTAREGESAEEVEGGTPFSSRSASPVRHYDCHTRTDTQTDRQDRQTDRQTDTQATRAAHRGRPPSSAPAPRFPWPQHRSCCRSTMRRPTTESSDSQPRPAHARRC